MLGQKIANTNVLEESGLFCLNECSPRLNILSYLGIRPVNEVEINVVETETVERFLDCYYGHIMILVAPGKLRGDDEIFTVGPTTADSLPNTSFVLIVEG